MSTKPNTSQITYDTGSNKQDLNNILDTVVPIDDYTALRNYTGRATQVRITAPGIAGLFRRNGSAPDNDGTVIVDGSGRSWERVEDYYLPKGAGAVPTTVQSKLRESVSVLDFGGVPNNPAAAEVNAVALNAAFAACKSVYIPEGVFYFNATVNLPIDAQLFGANKITSKLQYTGTNIALNLAGGYTNIRDLYLMGNSIVPRAYDVGTTGIYSNVFGGNLVMESARIQGFAKLVDCGPVGTPPVGGGGFYWKFYDVKFTSADVIMSNVSSNNLSFFGCAFFEFNQGIQSYGGSDGPISFLGCSVEAWSGVFIGPVFGGRLQLVMHGCYIENYPETSTTGTGLSSFTAAFLVSGNFSSISFIGNNVQCKGIRRILFNENTVESVVVSENNLFYVNTNPSASNTENLYTISGGVGFKAMDTVIPTADTGGTYTTDIFVSSNIKNILGVNPLTTKALSTGWTEITPSTYWSNSVTPGFPELSCKVENGVFYLRGQVTCTNVLGNIIGVVPSSILSKLNRNSAYYVGCLSEISTEAVSRFRVLLSNGSLLVATPTVGTFDIVSTPWPINT